MLNDDSLHRCWGDGGGMERRDESGGKTRLKASTAVPKLSQRLALFSAMATRVKCCLLWSVCRVTPPVSQAGSTHFIRSTG